ncbi:Uncharacterized protein APZ42_003060 [Daphnia magna]|uniref:Uncharacterized protein n=1 Tax=Daphnia magna TaxID=35525 RepID=A0A164HV22_9CRUS|nr:Uncharacterized protein APZ42_003060 [Daphnia magna]
MLGFDLLCLVPCGMVSKQIAFSFLLASCNSVLKLIFFFFFFCFATFTCNFIYIYYYISLHYISPKPQKMFFVCVCFHFCTHLMSLQLNLAVITCQLSLTSGSSYNMVEQPYCFCFFHSLLICFVERKQKIN